MTKLFINLDTRTGYMYMPTQFINLRQFNTNHSRKYLFYTHEQYAKNAYRTVNYSYTRRKIIINTSSKIN